LPVISYPRIASENNYNEQSGGFPHSDISGSKPIPGSPKLNAGYHVLHRLLLPRHPPNALFALDLIQEEHDRITSYECGRLPEVNSMYFPATHARKHGLASVLDLEQYHLSGYYPEVIPYSGQPDDTDVNLSKRCQFVRNSRFKPHPLQDDQTHAVCLMIMQVAYFNRVPHAIAGNRCRALTFCRQKVLVGRGGLEPPTSRLSGARSNHLSYRPDSIFGGAYRDRTDDLLNANQALSQLS
jgi:hypothetical protein